MLSGFDRRVVPDEVLHLLRLVQARSPALLAGGAALGGAFLAHRLSRDVDLFFDSGDDLRAMTHAFAEIAESAGGRLEIRRDAGSFVRARVLLPGGDVEVDLVRDAMAGTETPPVLEGIFLRPLSDLRAAKLTCILSRSEPRDLVDLLFLDRAGFPPEADLELALQKDAGVDPAALAWILTSFPLSPLPEMLVALDRAELESFRADLCERFRRRAVPIS